MRCLTLFSVTHLMVNVLTLDIDLQRFYLNKGEFEICYINIVMFSTEFNVDERSSCVCIYA